MTPIERSLLGLVVGYAFREGIAWLLKQRRLSALAGVAEAAQDVIKAALTTTTKQEAIAAAKAAVLQDNPKIQNSLEASLDVLLAGHIEKAMTAPGGATVQLPALNGEPLK